MALDPIELIAIGGIVVVIMVWGPSKIPEFAKMFGQAKREFDMAQKQFQQVTKEFQTQAGLTGTASSAAGGSLLERFAAMANAPGQSQQAPPGQSQQAPPGQSQQAPPGQSQQAPLALPAQSVAPATATAGSIPDAQASTPAAAAVDSRSADQVLIETARELGIFTEGKTRDEISKEIVAKAKSATASTQ